MQEFSPAVVVQTKEYVDPTFLYGIESNVQIFVVDSSGGRIRVNRHNTNVYSKYEIQSDSHSYNTDSIAYAVKKAYDGGHDPIIVIEDNCVIPKSFIEFYIKAFTEGPQHSLDSKSRYLNVIGIDNVFPRNYPFQHRVNNQWDAKPINDSKPIIAHMGLWRGVLDAAPSYKRIPDRVAFRGYSGISPNLLACSFANFGIRRDAAILLNPLPLPFGKPSDTLAGIVAQALIAKSKYTMSFGKPTVKRVSVNIEENFLIPSILDEFTDWVIAYAQFVESDTFIDMYEQLANNLKVQSLRSPLAYETFKDIPQHMLEWVSLFK